MSSVLVQDFPDASAVVPCFASAEFTLTFLFQFLFFVDQYCGFAMTTKSLLFHVERDENGHHLCWEFRQTVGSFA